MSHNKDMGDQHEAYVNKLLRFRGTPGSGNQWKDPADGRHNRQLTAYAFAYDGKSTCAKSISVTRAMWAKIELQAGGERPMLALRFYADYTLRGSSTDLAVTDLADFGELLDAARLWEQARQLLADISGNPGLHEAGFGRFRDGAEFLLRQEAAL